MTTVGTGPLTPSGRSSQPRTVTPSASNSMSWRIAIPLLSESGLHGVADGLDPDEAVAEHEGVDAVLDTVAAALGAPLQEQDVVLEDGGLDVPGRLGHLAEELGERLADGVLAALHAGRGDEDGVVAVVGDDLVQVLGSQRLRVVVEGLLGLRDAAMRPRASSSS